MSHYRWLRTLFPALLLGLQPLPSLSQSTQGAPAQTLEGPPYQRVIVDPERDLRTTLDGEFSLAAVGDVVAIRPTANLAVPEVQAIYDVLRGADVAFGNLEMTIADPVNVAPYNDARMFQALGRPVIADDLSLIGFDLMNFANNHTTHYSIAGMLETQRHMERVGIVTAGWGRHLAEARSAKFLDTPNGRIGFLGITTNSFWDARPAGEDSPGVPGANALHPQRIVTISRESFDALRHAHASSPYMFPGLYPISSRFSFVDDGDRIRLYDELYVPGDKAGFSYEIPPAELESYAREIRDAKFLSDFVVANIHSHHWQVPPDARSAGEESRDPPDFLMELARTAIDNGADAFFSHGEGELRGIEIYNGKPIFYQLGNFNRHPFFQEVFNPEFRERAARNPSVDVANLTRAQVQALMYPTNHDREYFESVVAVSRYNEGVLEEIRLFPVDLKFDGPFVDIGTPHLASGEVARRVLQTLQDASAAFGTEIRISGDTGIIEIGR